MSPDIANNDFKELVRSRTDLVALVQESVGLTPSRGGAEFKAICPFHDDHNPSMIVYPDRQTFRCWSCNTGGDCFGWVMEYDKVEFRQALETLAKRAGLEMPTFAGRRQESSIPKADVFDALTWAENEFHRCLLDSQMSAAARDYLRERGFTDETIAKFKLGFAPNDGQWLLARARNRFTNELLETAKLVRKSEQGSGHYSFFRGRVMFPIRNDKGQCVSFGGRVLPEFAQEGVGKYINGMDSEVYNKSNLLFGFDAARDTIRKSKTAIVVEGYADCIISHQFGVTNVVGVCGTSLTQSHVDRMKRFADRFVLMFDGDQAGQDAAEKALANFLAESVELRVLVLPDGQDPDEYLFAHGAEAFRSLIENAIPAWDFKLQAELNRNGLETIEARHRVLTNMLSLLAKVHKLRGSSKEDVILNRLSSRVGLNESVVRQRLVELRAARPVDVTRSVSEGGRPNALTHASDYNGMLPNGNARDVARPQGAVNATTRTNSALGGSNTQKTVRIDGSTANRGLDFSGRNLTKEQRLECDLLEIIFVAPELLTPIRQEIGDEDFQHEQTRSLLQVCFDLWDFGEPPGFDRILTALEDVTLKHVAVWIDEQARKKEIVQKLNDNSITHDNTTMPQYLRQTLDGLRWRREELQHQRATGRLAQQAPEPSSGLNHNAKALLEQLSDFHTKRAAITGRR